MTWLPKIIAFCCNWCAYAGADTAGLSRFQYPPSISILRVMCTGRIEPSMILKCFEQGADGVMVLGCHPGDCHYISGNECARSRIETTLEIMEILGIDKRRLLLKWISASEGALFAETAKDFTETIRSLGPFRGESQDDQR